MRHHLFVVPPLVVLSAIGIEEAHLRLRRGWARLGLTAVVIALITITLWDMVRLHPNQYVYFNRLFAGGLKEAAASYQTDYWENSYKQGVKWLDTRYSNDPPGRKLRIGAGGANVRYLLAPDRYVFVDIPEDIDLYLSTTREDLHRMVPGEVIHTVRADGVALLYIIRPDSSYNGDPFFAPPARRNFHLAWKYDMAGNLEKALAAYRKTLESDPRNPLIYNNLASIHLKLGQAREAVDLFLEALRLDPQYLNAFLRLGNALYAQSKFDSALSVYRKVVALEPGNTSIVSRLGNTLYALGHFEKAVQTYRKLVRMDPKNSLAYANLGSALYAQDRWKEAIQTYRKALKISPDNAAILFNLAVAQNAQGSTDEAIQTYRQTIQLEPDLVDAYRELAEIYETSGRVEEAIQAYRRILLLTPEDSGIRARLQALLQSPESSPNPMK